MEKQYQNPEDEVVMDEGAEIREESEAGCEGEQCDNVSDGSDESVSESEKMTDETAEWRDKYLRLQAEFDNFRKRTLKEKMDLVSSASEDVIKCLLPVLDDFDRALTAMETASDVESVREGVVLISHKLRDVLKSKGMAEIEAMGKVLDVDFHEAIAKIPAPKSNRGKVVDVVQKGYMINDKVIRHSKVVVGDKE